MKEKAKMLLLNFAFELTGSKMMYWLSGGKEQRLFDELLSLIPGQVTINRSIADYKDPETGVRHWHCPVCKYKWVLKVSFRACPICQSTIIWKGGE